MFYEEKVLNGVLHYRNIPGGAWIEVSKEVLTEKYLREKDNNGGYAQLADVLAEFEPMIFDFVESHNEENVRLFLKDVLGKYFS